MLKVRVIPTLLFKEVGLVKGNSFNNNRRVGSVLPAIKVYNNREVDELLLLDIAATPSKRSPDFETIATIMPFCLMPLTIGGGITNLKDIQKLLHLGVDKIVINSYAYENPNFISEAANKFGSQCIIVSIDVKKNTQGEYECYSHNGTVKQNFNTIQWAQMIEKLGAGELLLNSIDYDGKMAGYDLEYINIISKEVNLPIIAAGGAGTADHTLQAIKEGASAVAIASAFHFTEQTPLSIKQFLGEHGVAVRKSKK